MTEPAAHPATVEDRLAELETKVKHLEGVAAHLRKLLNLLGQTIAMHDKIRHADVSPLNPANQPQPIITNVSDIAAMRESRLAQRVEARLRNGKTKESPGADPAPVV